MICSAWDRDLIVSLPTPVHFTSCTRPDCSSRTSALAAVSRLLEPTPSALYSDVEHARLHWIRKHTKAKGKKGRVVPQDVVEGRAQLPTKDRQEEVHQRFQLEKGPKVVVMDKQKAGWLGTWDTLFVRPSNLKLRQASWDEH